MKWTWRDTCAIGLIAVVVAAFFFRLFWPIPRLIITPDFGQSDAVSAIATKYFYSTQLQQHRIPLWTSLIGGGYPIFALGTLATFFLPNLILFSILNLTTAYNVSLVLTVCLMGWGMYVWLRLMKYGLPACVFGSITTVLSGYVIAQLTHITIVQSYCLFPWLAALTLRLADKKSWFTVGWFILLLSQQIFIGFPQSVFITLLFLGAYWIWLIRTTENRIQKTFLFSIAVVAGAVASAVQLLPSFEYSKTLTVAGGFTPDQATSFSYPLRHLLTLGNPFALGNPAAGTYPYFSQFIGSIFWENAAYIGLIPLMVLALYIGVAIRKKLRPGPVIFFVLVLGASLLLMTGRDSPLYLIYSFWPFNMFRVPSRFVWLFEIALIVLAVHAFDRLMGFVKSKLVLYAALLLIFFHALSLVSIWSPYHKLINASDWLQNPPLARYVDRNFYTVSIGAEGLYNDFYALRGWMTTDSANDPAYFLRNTLTPDNSMLWGVPQFSEYTGRTIRRSGILTDLLNQSITRDVSNATQGAQVYKLLSLLSVKNVVSALPLTQEGLSHTSSVSFGDKTIDLYDNPGALPLVYFAAKAIPVHTVEEAVAAFASDSFIPGDSVLVEFDATPAATLSRGDAKINVSGQGFYVVSTSNPNADAILVLTQTYYPGWHATVDTKEVPVFPVNIKHVGVRVPAGNHTVEFRYRPESFLYGAWISGISLGVTIVLMAFGSFRSLLNTHQKAAARGIRLRRNRGT